MTDVFDKVLEKATAVFSGWGATFRVTFFIAVMALIFGPDELMIRLDAIGGWITSFVGGQK